MVSKRIEKAHGLILSISAEIITSGRKNEWEDFNNARISPPAGVNATKRTIPKRRAIQPINNHDDSFLSTVKL